MRIAITSLYLPSGSKIGVGYQVHHLANALVCRGHDVTVFSQSGASSDSLYRVRVVPARSRLRTFGFAWDLRQVDFTSFDVLNAHGDDWFLCGRRLPRHIHTYHGSCLAEMLHSRSLTGKARMGALALCEYGSILLADETVAVSENTRHYIPGIRHIVPCGVDTRAFRPGNRKSARPTILFVGTMEGRKRGAMLLELFKTHIQPRVPDAELWCVCEKPAGTEERPGVRWLGRVPGHELPELYRQAWAFCLPSTYEGFGVPYIEAMASGTPVVATRNVGATEVTRGGFYGLLVPDEHLSSALVRLLCDSELRAALRVVGLERAQEYSWDRVCERYEVLYSGNSQPIADPVAA